MYLALSVVSPLVTQTGLSVGAAKKKQSEPHALLADVSAAVLQEKLMPSSNLLSRIGVPQVASLLLLLIFVLQCVWFMAHVPLSAMEGSFVEAGLLHLERLSNASSTERYALVPLLAGVAARLSGAENKIVRLGDHRFAIRLPFMCAGFLLGVSLWYVARRLYGNVGGYIALGLFCFSPVIIGWSSQVGPGIVAAWGAFGLVFTAAAVAHTISSPSQPFVWNWRRILLMGLSIAMCIGAQFSLWILLLPALGFMLWVAHLRRGAAIAIFAAACGTGLLLLWAVYSFRTVAFARALSNAEWLEVSGGGVSRQAIPLLFETFFLQNGIGLLLLLVVTLVTFLVWKRARFFGTAAPLITGALLFASAARMHFAGQTFLLVGLPFLILFMAGVSADLLESHYALAANAVIGGVLIANAIIDVYGLLHLTSRSR